MAPEQTRGSNTAFSLTAYDKIDFAATREPSKFVELPFFAGTEVNLVSMRSQNIAGKTQN